MRGESPQHVAADPVFRGICPVFWVVAFGVEILYCPDAFSGDFGVVELLVHFDAVFEVYEAVGDSFPVVANACYEAQSCYYDVSFAHFKICNRMLK